MSGYDELRDRYEDAMLAYLMESVKVAEGRAAIEENEQLKADPSAAVPASLDDKCLKLINQGYRNGKFRRSGQKTLKIVSRVAIIAAVLILSFAVAFAVSPAIRSLTTTWIVNTFKDGTVISSPLPDDYDSMKPDPRQTVFEGLTLQAGWIPDGFKQYSARDNFMVKYVGFRGADHGRLEAQVSYTIGTNHMIDTEDSDISYLDIFGTTATLINKHGRESHSIVWFIEDAGATVVVFGENVSEEDTVTFAKNLIIK